MKRIIFLSIVLIAAIRLPAVVWQWSAPVTEWISDETGDHPQAFLWIPENCERVRAVIVGMHNMCEEPVFEHPEFRRTMAELGFAIVWISPLIDYQWNVGNGCQKAFDEMMNALANVSGYEELKTAPIVPLGHSAMATFPWNFAAWNKERTLAIVSYKGDAPRTNLTGYGRENLEWGCTRNIDGIPGLMIEGEYEWWEARVNPALAFRMMYPGSCISFLADAGHGHFDVSDEVVGYICLFLKKAAEYRLFDVIAGDDPQSPVISIDSVLRGHDGWLAARWKVSEKIRPAPAPFSEYKGDPHDAFWYFDREIAEATEKYYAKARGEKEPYIGYIQNGKLLHFDPNLHARINGAFEPEADGLTFRIKAVFTDTLRLNVVKGNHRDIRIDRICGPVEKVNDTTFTVCFYRMGLNNPRRTGDIWLMAYHKGDGEYNSSVQQINIRIPYRNTGGKEQKIMFPEIENVRVGTKAITLKAKSDSGLPVYYYVKEGAAKIVDNHIVFTEIPPRSRMPHKITVVAWQYGIAGKVRTAEAVERSFYVLDHDRSIKIQGTHSGLSDLRRSS
jgi:hypothetical protein